MGTCQSSVSPQTDGKLNEETYSLSLAEIPYKKVLSRRQPSLTLCNTVSFLAINQQSWNTFALHADVSYAMFIFHIHKLE